MIETEKKQERVLLVGVTLRENSYFESSMKELAGLAKTAGAEVITTLTQKRNNYDSKYLIGSGKLSEIVDVIEAENIDSLIVNNRLTPRQNHQLEAVLGIKVIDRMQLILDIFAMRAKSHEGKLQVHLAQLKYLLPRLVGQGIMLSRQAGGIGSRGPGESQLEINRRAIHNQINDIERQLKEVEKNRHKVRERRLASGVFKLGLIGYTNAGKSTLMNLLTQKDQYEADELFATLDATTKQFKLQGQFQVTLTDTVGFIQDLPTELVSSFKSTLEESRHLDLLIHVIDASDQEHSAHEEVVLNLLKALQMDTIPRLTLYNKADLLQDFTPGQLPYSLISAKEPSAKEQLETILMDKIKTIAEPFQISLPLTKWHDFHQISPYLLIENRQYQDDLENISGYLMPTNRWRLEAFYDNLS